MESFLKDRSQLNPGSARGRHVSSHAGGFTSFASQASEGSGSLSSRVVAASSNPPALEGKEIQEIEVQTESDDKPNHKVQLVMNDGRVESILVTCGCGECIELQCQY